MPCMPLRLEPYKDPVVFIKLQRGIRVHGDLHHDASCCAPSQHAAAKVPYAAPFSISHIKRIMSLIREPYQRMYADARISLAAKIQEVQNRAFARKSQLPLAFMPHPVETIAGDSQKVALSLHAWRPWPRPLEEKHLPSALMSPRKHRHHGRGHGHPPLYKGHRLAKTRAENAEKESSPDHGAAPHHFTFV